MEDHHDAAQSRYLLLSLLIAGLFHTASGQVHCTQGSIRLQGGTTTSGRVEVCHMDVWGTVCDDEWGLADSQVACRQLQLPTAGATIVIGYDVPDGTGRIWLDNVDCIGIEGSLFDCDTNDIGRHDCQHHEDAGVSCKATPCMQGSIRLEENTNNSGHVEVCHINVWGKVCDNYGWGLADAIVTCRQLELPTTGATTLSVNYIPGGIGLSWLRGVRCFGNERSLFNCNARPSETICYSHQYAGVSCQDSQAPCTQGSIRLQTGTNTSGHVEVCHINVWGTVCYSGWGLADAQVACRQLGLPTTGATTLSLPDVAGDTAVCWLTNVRCVGTERSLFRCNVRPFETNCHHSQYAGVSCEDSQAPCTQGSIRLQTGTNNSGHVEVCHINVWGTVCYSGWGLVDAQVACRQLGLPTTGATTLSLPDVAGDIAVSWLTFVRCVGTERSLFSCNVRPFETDCYRSQLAGVSCKDSKAPCTQGSIRLQAGTNTSGHVEVCHINVWGTVCYSGWGIADAQVACRQLGFPTTGATTLSLPDVAGGIAVSWLTNVRCDGTERSLFSCNVPPFETNCHYSQYAGVSCQDSQAPCTQGLIRLRGGTTFSGRVEVCHINVWGTICVRGWGLANAQVACRQLGLPSTGATTLSVSGLPNNTTVIWLKNVRCVGTESSLFNCRADLTGNNYCPPSGVYCQNSQAACTQGSIRLQGGTTISGRVEVCHINVWGTLCGYRWGLANAQVACRELGLPSTGATTLSVSGLRSSTAVIWRKNVRCAGNESSLFNCKTALHRNYYHPLFGIYCQNSQNPCTQGSIRLQEGTNTSGRVEVCHINVWGRVCDNGWGLADAQVACRQLRLPTTGATTLTVYSNYSDTKVIWLRDIRCVGTESSLFNCSVDLIERYSYCYDAGVNCQASQALCTQGSIRLQGGTNTSGCVEVCHINVWGTVCGDGWGLADAQVACRQLGLPTTGAATLAISTNLSETHVVWLRDVRCVGTESSLFNCSADLIGTKYCLTDAEVSCQNSQAPCTQGSIRLQGNTNTTGHVEVCHINVWGTVCSDGWGLADAQVACRQLGLPTAGATIYSASDVPGVTRVTWFENVRCIGTESSLFNCAANFTGNNYCLLSDAGVSCQTSKTSCTQGSIRLKGNTNTSGRVEVCHINVWGTVCSDGWGLAQAQVACRQLGLPTMGATIYSASGITRVTWFENVRCIGTERSLFNCTADLTGNNYCLLSNAGVNCQISQAPCTEGSIRLLGGTTFSGRVEFCHINIWGTVCADSAWGLIDAQVTCRQLGLPASQATTLSVSSVLDGTRVIWLRNVTCNGTESSLFNCTASIGNNYCYASDVGLSCQPKRPDPPTNITVSSSGPHSISLTWTCILVEEAPVLIFIIYIRNVITSSDFSQVASLSVDDVTIMGDSYMFTVNNGSIVLPSTWYTLRVIACNMFGCSDYSQQCKPLQTDQNFAMESTESSFPVIIGTAVPFSIIAAIALTLIVVAVCIFCYKQYKFRIYIKPGGGDNGRLWIDDANTYFISESRAKWKELMVDCWEIPTTEVIVENYLKEGAFGMVFKGTIRGPLRNLKLSAKLKQTIGLPIAIKLLKDTATSKERSDFLVEMDMMKKISEGYCNNIVNMVGCVTLQEPLCLITEFVPHGDLLEYLRNQRKKNTSQQREEKYLRGQLEQLQKACEEMKQKMVMLQNGQAEVESHFTARSYVYAGFLDGSSPQSDGVASDMSDEHWQEQQQQQQLSISSLQDSAKEEFQDHSFLFTNGISGEVTDEEKSEEADSAAIPNMESMKEYSHLDPLPIDKQEETAIEKEDTYADVGELDANDLKKFAYQIATGMEYLSSINIVHRDLACRNILVGDGKILKITDFGLSREVEDVYVNTTKGRLPLKWMALESIEVREFTTQSDVWSYGVTLWEIGTMGGFPYPTIQNQDLLMMIKQGYRLEKPENCAAEVYNIMLECWQEHPLDRPTFPELRNKFIDLVLASTSDSYLVLQIDETKTYYTVGEEEKKDSKGSEESLSSTDGIKKAKSIKIEKPRWAQDADGYSVTLSTFKEGQVDIEDEHYHLSARSDTIELEAKQLHSSTVVTADVTDVHYEKCKSISKGISDEVNILASCQLPLEQNVILPASQPTTVTLGDQLGIPLSVEIKSSEKQKGQDAPRSSRVVKKIDTNSYVDKSGTLHPLDMIGEDRMLFEGQPTRVIGSLTAKLNTKLRGKMKKI